MSVAELTIGAEAPVLELSGAALFLDLDGTLAPIVSRPDQVVPDARRTHLLEKLCEGLDGRLAVVSGRTLGTIDRILDGAAPAAAGVHGLERRRADGVVLRAQPNPALPAVVAELEAFAAARPGLLVEDKGLSVGLHYRQAPGQAKAVLALAERLAAGAGLRLQRGDMVAELRTPGADKGAAVEAFMQEAPFIGASPVFVGDDLTDEDGFRAVGRLGGLGVLVGPPRDTAARARLDDVDDVLGWLAASLGG